MSHKFYKPARSRLQRSELAVPGSSPKMFEKALSSAADYVFLDLEDAVSPNDKITARANVIKSLNEMNGSDYKDVKRIVFHEITKTAVNNAINNPREIDMDLVNAQQARRALDYLVGFTLSRVLWRKLPGAKSFM